MEAAEDAGQLRREHAELRAEVARLRDENTELKAQLTRFGRSISDADRSDFAKALLLLEHVYSDLVATTKQQLLAEIKRDTDDITRTVLAKHEKIRDEVLLLQQQSLALQERLRSAEDASNARETYSKTSVNEVVEIEAPTDLRPTLSNTSHATQPVPPIEYYLMRGDYQLAETVRSSPSTPNFFKTSRTRQDGNMWERKGKRPTTSWRGGELVPVKVAVHNRPLTSSAIHRDFIQRKLNPVGRNERQRRPYVRDYSAAGKRP